MHKPAKRCQRTILPQGIKNNLTICQLYVSQSLVNIPKDVLLIHYMDELLLAYLDTVYLQRTAKKVLKDLVSLHLMVVPNGSPPFACLGLSIIEQVCPLSFKLEMKELYSFSERQ